MDNNGDTHTSKTVVYPINLQGFVHTSKTVVGKKIRGISGCQASSLFRPLGGSWSMIYEVPFGRRGGTMV